jgi:hypothetical protein
MVNFLPCGLSGGCLEEQKVLIRGKHIAISKFSPSSIHDSSRILEDFGRREAPSCSRFFCVVLLTLLLKSLTFEISNSQGLSHKFITTENPNYNPNQLQNLSPNVQI